MTARPIVIAHRGASGYLPEHTLAAYSLAVFQGADFIEPDLVSTADGHLVARHDNVLDLTTDVARRSEFESRRCTKTVDGVEVSGWFSEDFTLAEIKTLRAIERIPEIRPANTRFDWEFEIPTLSEIIALVRALEPIAQRPIGLYPETKHPTYFSELGLGLEEPLVRILHDAGYVGAHAPVFVQSFEVDNLRRLRETTDLRLVQLLWKEHGPYDQRTTGRRLTYDEMATPTGLSTIAEYADAVGPEKEHFILPRNGKGALEEAALTPFVAEAHEVGLQVHPFTYRAENAFLPTNLRRGSEPTGFGDLAAELRPYLRAGINGLFADQPNLARRAVEGFLGLS